MNPQFGRTGESQVSRFAHATRKQCFLFGQPGLPDPGTDRVTGRLCDFELHGRLVFCCNTIARDAAEYLASDLSAFVSA